MSTAAAPRFGVAFAMPTRWTFQQPPVAAFVARHTAGRRCIVDPFCGQSTLAHHRNDLASGGVDAETFVRGLIAQGVRADCVIFDPPYSPRQISECYQGIGRTVTAEDTQNARLYKRVRAALAEILDPDGLALSFGWQSSGFGKDWPTLDLLLVQHGGAHNDTICVAQTMPHPPTPPNAWDAPVWHTLHANRDAPRAQSTPETLAAPGSGATP